MIQQINGYFDGSGSSPYSAHADHTHDAANQAASTAADAAALKADFNALLIKLKNAGVMTPDALTLVYAAVTDSTAGHADRQYNTDKISDVTIDNDAHTITITLSVKVSQLKDFQAGGGWGNHKWLGIGLSVGITPITALKYNGESLTAADVEEATYCGLSSGYFVRWVAADLVLAGDNTQKSVNWFDLWADGCANTRYTLTIVEPA